jgi:rhodanese-related sulfurtransferase
MRYPVIIGLILLMVLLFILGRHLQAPIHVSDKIYDLLLGTLLSHSVPEVSIDQLASGHFRVLDARSYQEFDVSHIQGATWVGYEEFDVARLAGIEKQAPLAVYCSVGYRSERLAETLRQYGYINVVNVYGGIFEWVNTGHPIVTGQATETDKVHAYSTFWGVWLKRGERVYH